MGQSVEDDNKWMSTVKRSLIEEKAETKASESLMTAFLGNSPEQGPPVQTHSLREFEEHLNDLKKENFSLKLRIYFLEERVKQKYEDSSEDVFKRNIELKVEVESLKRELRDKQQFLEKSWVAADHPSCHNDAELRCHYEMRQQQTEHSQEFLEDKIQLLQEETKIAKNEVDRMAALAEKEKKSCLELSRKLEEFTAEMTEARNLQKQYCVTLADKDKMLQQLAQVLDSKDAVIQQLSTEKQNQQDKRIKCLEVMVQELTASLQQKDNELKISHEKRHQMSSKLSAANEVSQKHDCTIQRLNETISSKTIKEEDLYQITDEQNEPTVRLQEMLHKSQTEALQVVLDPVSEVSPPCQVPGAPHPAQPQGDLLNLQNSLSYTQLELQKTQRAVRQKESQLADAKHALQLLETDLRDVQHQKETTCVQNQDLHGALHQLEAQLQEAHEQLHTVQVQNNNVIQEQQLTIERQNQALHQKEQLLQDHIYLLQCQEGQVKGQGIKDSMLEKLQERIRERDKALERAVDEKYSAVEEREGKLHQLQLSMREKEHNLQRLQNVLSRNEETINSLNGTLKSKDLEIQQISTALKHLQMLKQEMEVKYSKSLKEREGFIEQLQTSLHDRHKELENIATSWLSQTTLENNEMVEKLHLCLQSKEKMLQDILSERNHQAVEHEKAIQELLKTLSTRDLAAEVASENTVWTLEEGSFKYRQCDKFSLKDSGLEDFAGENDVPSLNQTDELGRLRALLEQKEEIIAELMDREADHSKMMVIVKNNDRVNQKGNHELQKELEKELANVKEEFQVVSRKEREAKMELSSLRSLVTKQNEELQVQAADVESLTRSVQIKEELIKDLQVQLVNPEEVPVVESLTQEVLKLREKVTILESQGQDGIGNRSQELILMLERLVAERCTLNEALQSERLLYSKLLNIHSHSKSCEEEKALQSELEAVRVLRGRLEEALEQSLQQLSNPEAENRALIDFGGGDGSSLQALHTHAI